MTSADGDHELELRPPASADGDAHAALAAPFDVRRIPITLIDEPAIAMRETMSDEGLVALEESLRVHGQLQNIGVIVAGDRYRVVYGHRRRIAAARAGLHELLCRVFAEGTAEEEALKVDENAEQEPVNAAAEATYYKYLLDERCGGDLDRLVALVRRRESYVLERLDLVRGYPEVLEALRADRVSIGVARELNKVHEEIYRRLYLHDAIEQGLNIKAVRVLRQQRDRDRRLNEVKAEIAAAEVPPSTVTALENMDACTFCHSPADQTEMTYVRVHRSCLAVWNRDEAEKLRGA